MHDVFVIFHPTLSICFLKWQYPKLFQKGCLFNGKPEFSKDSPESPRAGTWFESLISVKQYMGGMTINRLKRRILQFKNQHSILIELKSQPTNQCYSTNVAVLTYIHLSHFSFTVFTINGIRAGSEESLLLFQHLILKHFDSVDDPDRWEGIKSSVKNYSLYFVL